MWLGDWVVSAASVRRACTEGFEETAAPGIGLVVAGVAKVSPGEAWVSKETLAAAVARPADSLAWIAGGAAVGTASAGTDAEEPESTGLPREAVSDEAGWVELRRINAHRARTKTQMAALVRVLVQLRAAGATAAAGWLVGPATGSPTMAGDSWTAGYCVAGESFSKWPEPAGAPLPAKVVATSAVAAGLAWARADVCETSAGKPSCASVADWTVGKENRTGTERAGPCCRRLVDLDPGRVGELWGVFAWFMGAIPFAEIPDPSKLPVLGKDVSARRSAPKNWGLPLGLARVAGYRCLGIGGREYCPPTSNYRRLGRLQTGFPRGL